MRLMTAIYLCCLSANASTWYVRPCVWTTTLDESPWHPVAAVGIYGTQNGTSYANAWNGLQDVVWGNGGVTNGDTLYVCGLHLYSVTNAAWSPFYQALINIDSSASGCSIRGDYASDPGVVCGVGFDRSKVYPWDGPDDNGVYRCTNWWGNNYYLAFQIDGTNITRLIETNTDTWSGGLGMWARVGNSNFLKTTAGDAPTTNIAITGYGWRLSLDSGLSNVTFVGMSFVATALVNSGYTYPDGYPAIGSRANHITFQNCTFREWSSFAFAPGSMLVNPQPGNDYWTFSGCELYNGPSGIYTGAGRQDSTNQLRGCVGLVVTNCYIHDLDVGAYHAEDGHAIGITFASDCVISHNRTERTGTSIALFSNSGRSMTNNLIEYNYVKDVHWHTDVNGTTTGNGIWVSSASQNTTANTRIIGNIVVNCGLPGTGDYSSSFGSAIQSSSPDYIEIYNNTVSNANYGIYIVVNSYPPLASVKNNIICDTTNYLVRIGNPTGGTVDCDYNLFFTNTPITTPFYFAGDLAHDSHSLYTNAQFTGGTITAMAFIPKAGSAAINAGANVGVSKDYLGNPIWTPPDIGAFEYQEIGRHLRGKHGISGKFKLQ